MIKGLCRYSVLLSVCCFVTAGGPVFAGFKWVPPSEPQNAPQQRVEQEALQPTERGFGESNIKRIRPGNNTIQKFPVEVETRAKTPETPDGFVPSEKDVILRNGIRQDLEPVPEKTVTPPTVSNNTDAIPAPLLDMPEDNNVPQPLIAASEVTVSGPGNLRDIPEPLSNSEPKQRIEIAPAADLNTKKLHNIVARQISDRAPATRMRSDDLPHVVGFGSDMPLAMALQQIVPPGTALSFATDINPGVNVSWNGGKPWPDVVVDMLAPLQLRAQFNGNLLFVSRGTGRRAVSSASETKFVAQTETETVLGPQRTRISDPGERASLQPALTEQTELVTPTAEPMAIAPANQPINSPASVPETVRTLVPVAPPQAAQFISAFAHLEEPEKREPRALIPPEPAPISLVSNDVQIWEVGKGASLRETLETWTKSSNHVLNWNAASDYYVATDVFVNDTFQSAVRTLFTRGFEGAVAPRFSMVNGPDGQITIVIEDRAL